MGGGFSKNTLGSLYINDGVHNGRYYAPVDFSACRNPAWRPFRVATIQKATSTILGRPLPFHPLHDVI